MIDPTSDATSLDRNQHARIAALKAVAILDTPPEDAFDALVRLAATVCDMPIAVVSLLDGERLWFKAVAGLPVSTIPSEQSFCKFATTTQTLLIVPDALSDPRFADSGLVAGDSKIRSYIGAPIFHDGVAIGTICALDRVPHTVPPKSSEAMIQLAVLATTLLRARIDAFKLFSLTYS